MTEEPTNRMVARPVWARRERRAVGVELDPPTEEEKLDAILVLRDNLLIPPSLYAEAEAIMREAYEGRTFSWWELVRDIDDEDFLPELADDE